MSQSPTLGIGVMEGTGRTRPTSGQNFRVLKLSDICANGLPKPSWRAHSPRYLAKFVIDDKSRETEVVRSTAPRWQRTLYFDESDSSSIDLRIYRAPTIGENVIVGWIQEQISTLLMGQHNQVITRKVITVKEAPSHQQLTVTLRIERISSPQSADALQAGNAINELNNRLEVSSSGVEQVIVSTVNSWEPLLRNLEQFVAAVDAIAEIHPFAKVAWSVLSFTYKTAIDQVNRDERIDELVATMADMYAFMDEAQPMEKIESHAKILAVMAKQTAECAYFIHEYAKSRSFFQRAITNRFTAVDEIIQRYQRKFNDLMTAFEGRAVLETEIAVGRVEDAIHLMDITVTRVLGITSDAAALIVINDIPYAQGVRFPTGRVILPSAHHEILEDILGLLNGTILDEDLRVLLLTGARRVERSAVATIIAQQFDEQNRLGSSFFFDGLDNTKNRTDHVFSTIACDLADLDPKIKENLWSSIKDKRSLRKTTSPREQFQRFILKPLEGLDIVGPVVIVIDALDRCGYEESRREPLDVLAENVPSLPDNFRFLLTSRHDVDILQKLGSLKFVRHAQMGSVKLAESSDVITSIGPSQAILETNVLKSFRVTTPGYTDRFLIHSCNLGFVESVTPISNYELKQDATWNIIPGLAGTGCYSFESRNPTGQYLRHKDFRVRIDAPDGTDLFEADATWRAETTTSGVRFSAYNYPDEYLRHFCGELWLATLFGSHTYDNPNLFTEDTTWAIMSPLASPPLSKLPLNVYKSLRVTTPGYTNRFVRHSDNLGWTEVVTVTSEDLLKNDASWKIVPGLAGTGFYSLESCNYRGYYLRHQGYRVRIDAPDGTDLFKADATWRAEFTTSGVRLSSFNYPDRYFRHIGAELWLANASGRYHFDTPVPFVEDTTWAMTPPWVYGE